MQSIGPAEGYISPEDIIREHSKELAQLVQSAVDPQYEIERVIQLNKARRNWQMVKGNHYLAPGMVASPYGEVADYIASDSSGDENGADIRFCRPINLIGGDLYKFIAVMGSSAPRIKAVADDPRDANSLEAGKNADATLRDLWQKVNADDQQRVLAFHQYTTGPTFLRNIFVRDSRKYGQTVEPKIDVQEGPDGSQIPVEGSEPQVYENGDVELRIYTVLDVTIPYGTKDLDSTPILMCEEMRSKWALIDAYPVLEKYRDQDLPDEDMAASSNTAAEARDAVGNPSGTGKPKKANTWRFQEVWIQPYLINSIDDEGLRGTLKRQFANGMYIARVGSVTVDLDSRKLTDEWAVCKTGRGEKILEDPICADSVPIQLALNDLMNLAMETILRAIAQTIVDSQLLDRESLAKKQAVPAEIILTAMPADGTDISKHIAQIPGARVSDQLMPVFTQLRTLMQDITGIRPELSGGGVPTQTYREAKQRKDQALMQLSPQAKEMQAAWVTFGENAVRMRARYGSGTIKSPRKGAFGPEVDTVDLASLQETGWHCESDDNFPMNSADRFDKMWALLKEFPPEVQQMLSILDPTNLEETLELLQIPGFESVVEDQKRKTLGDIAQLLQGQAIDGQPGPNGTPGPKQSSIAPDQYDDHAFVAAFAPKWMISATGQKAKQENPAGFENVVVFWQAHQQMAQPPQPPPVNPVRAALNIAAKLEDFPGLVPEVMQGAGLPAPPPGAEIAQVPVKPEQPPDTGMPAPQPMESQESPLPPPTGGSEGPQLSA